MIHNNLISWVFIYSWRCKTRFNQILKCFLFFSKTSILNCFLAEWFFLLKFKWFLLIHCSDLIVFLLFFAVILCTLDNTIVSGHFFSLNRNNKKFPVMGFPQGIHVLIYAKFGHGTVKLKFSLWICQTPTDLYWWEIK